MGRFRLPPIIRTEASSRFAADFAKRGISGVSGALRPSCRSSRVQHRIQVSAPRGAQGARPPERQKCEQRHPGPVIWPNEPVALLHVKPLHCSGWHLRDPRLGLARVRVRLCAEAHGGRGSASRVPCLRIPGGVQRCYVLVKYALQFRPTASAGRPQWAHSNPQCRVGAQR